MLCCTAGLEKYTYQGTEPYLRRFRDATPWHQLLLDAFRP